MSIDTRQHINNFRVWIYEGIENDYTELSVCEKKDGEDGYEYYINLHKDPRFPVDFSVVPKVLKEGEIESLEDQIYRKEYFYYSHRKDQGQPLWRLHKSTVERVLHICRNICTTN